MRPAVLLVVLAAVAGCDTGDRTVRPTPETEIVVDDQRAEMPPLAAVDTAWEIQEAQLAPPLLVP